VSPSTYGTLVFQVAIRAAMFLPQRVALLALDRGAALLFGRAERGEFVNTRGDRVTL
jgi:hypothetical protein